MIDPQPLMAGTDQSRQNMWRKMLNYPVHRNVPGACATYWSAPHTATACQVARPPARIRLELPALGDFYSQAFDGSVPLPVAEYDYNSGWTPSVGGTLTRWNGS